MIEWIYKFGIIIVNHQFLRLIVQII